MLPDELWELRVEQGEHVEQDQVLVVHILEHVPDTAVELLRAHSVARISMIWIFIVFFSDNIAATTVISLFFYRYKIFDFPKSGFGFVKEAF